MSRVSKTGASVLLGVDGLFLGALLFIAVSVKADHVKRLSDWPDAGGGPGALLPWAAAGAVAFAALLCRLRSPVPPLLLLAGAIGLTAFALRRMADAGAFFGSGRYGNVAHILALAWILHLVLAIAALGKGIRPARFVALQAAFGAGLAALVYPA